MKNKYKEICFRLLGLGHCSGNLFRYENALPSLPVPNLDDTMNRYLESLKPITSPTEYQESEKVVMEFKKPGGMGLKLQSRLIAHANKHNLRNWLLDWWNEDIYFK